MGSNPVVVLCPMDCECEWLVSKLAEKRKTDIAGYVFYEGKADELDVVVVRCLIGTVNAAVATAIAIKTYSPGCVILQGTAGAHNPELKKNDIVIAEKIIPISNTVSPKRALGEGSAPFEWKDFGVQAYFKNKGTEFVSSFCCDNSLVALAKSVPYDDGRIVVGNIGCGDVWNREADLILHYHNTKGTQCEAMEGIGAAQTCAAFNIPMLEIRVISNCELNENESFSKNCAENCQRFVYGLLKSLAS